MIKTREVLDQVEVKVQGIRSPFHTCVARGYLKSHPSGCWIGKWPQMDEWHNWSKHAKCQMTWVHGVQSTEPNFRHVIYHEIPWTYCGIPVPVNHQLWQIMVSLIYCNLGKLGVSGPGIKTGRSQEMWPHYIMESWIEMFQDVSRIRLKTKTPKHSRCFSEV